MQKVAYRSRLVFGLWALFAFAGCQTPGWEPTPELLPVVITHQMADPDPTPLPQQPYLTLEAAAGPVTEVIFSRDGQWIAGMAQKEAIHIWQVSDGALLSTIETGDLVDTLAFSPDGTLLAGTLWNAQAIGLWDTSDGTLLIKIDLSAPAIGLDFAPDGASLVAGLWNGIIEVHAVPDGSLLSSFSGSQHTITALDISPDGSLLATAAEDAVRVWRIAEQVQFFHIEEYTTQVAFSPRGDILATGAPNHAVHLWSLADGSIQAVLGQRASQGIAFSHDGSLLVSGAANVVEIWRTGDATLWFYLNTRAGLNDLDLSPNLIAVACLDGKIYIFYIYQPL